MIGPGNILIPGEAGTIGLEQLEVLIAMAANPKLHKQWLEAVKANLAALEVSKQELATHAAGLEELKAQTKEALDGLVTAQAGIADANKRMDVRDEEMRWRENECLKQENAFAAREEKGKRAEAEIAQSRKQLEADRSDLAAEKAKLDERAKAVSEAEAMRSEYANKIEELRRIAG